MDSSRIQTFMLDIQDNVRQELRRRLDANQTMMNVEVQLFMRTSGAGYITVVSVRPNGETRKRIVLNWYRLFDLTDRLVGNFDESVKDCSAAFLDNY